MLAGTLRISQVNHLISGRAKQRGQIEKEFVDSDSALENLKKHHLDTVEKTKRTESATPFVGEIRDWAAERIYNGK